MARGRRKHGRQVRLHPLVFRSRHHWVRVLFRSKWRTAFETDPQFQYRVHMAFTYVWVVNMVVAVAVFTFAKGFWNHASVLYLVLVSLYANFATDYGAVSAAEAAQMPKPEHVAGSVTVNGDPPVAIEGDVTIEPQ